MKADSASELLSGLAAQGQLVRNSIDALLTRLLVEGSGSIGAADLAQLAAQAHSSGWKRVAEEAGALEKAVATIQPEALAASIANLSRSLDAEVAGINPAKGSKETSKVEQGNAHGSARVAGKTAGIAEDLELLSDFVVEAREHLTTIEGELLALEQDPQNATVMNAIFRAFHTIKGMAGFLELETVQRVAHHVETLLDLARNSKLAVTPLLVDLVLESADFLRVAVNSAELRSAGQTWIEQEFPLALVERLEAAQRGQSEAGVVPENNEGRTDSRRTITPAADYVEAETPDTPGSEPDAERQTTVHVAEILPPAGAAFMQPVVPEDRRQGGKESTQMRRGETQPLSRRPAAVTPTPLVEAPEAAGVSAAAATAAAPAAKNMDSTTVRVETGKLDHLLEMIGEMVIAQSLVEQHPAMAALQEPLLAANLLLLSRITKEVQSAAMGVRMNPIGQLFQRSARLVRDLSRRAGKDVKLELAGEDTEIDRKIAEELADPLMHMIRNALDHGIETPSERAVSGKNPLATLRLAAYHQGGQIVVEIADDGRGLNRQKILAKAMQNGLVDDAVDLTDDQVNHLIFEPGFSTAETITDISGRGVGMDVVKRQVQKLRGRIEIESNLGAGTHFFLKLPLTLAILDVLIVGVGPNRYLLPIASVRQIFRPTSDMLSSIHGKSEMVLQHDRLLPIIRLHQRFKVEPQASDPCVGLLIEAECEGRVFCLMVDEMLGRQEVVMKSLGDMFKGIPGVASCAILGDGKVGLILDMAGIFAAPGLNSGATSRSGRTDGDVGVGVPAYLADSFATPAPGAAAHRAQTAGSVSMGR